MIDTAHRPSFSRGWSRTALARSLCVVAMLSLGTTRPAVAHPGGHALQAGDVLDVWTDPTTGQAVPASLLFVSGGQVNVEDVAGHRRAWPLDSLSAPDRARAEAFRARVEARHRRGLPAEPSPAQRPVAPPVPWPVVAIAFAAAMLAWSWRARGHMSRWSVAASLATLAVACSGNSVTSGSSTTASSSATSGSNTPADVAAYFSAFPGHVRTRQDATTLYVESDGLADHPTMVGIRSWQQQVPLPANYTGSNAWTIPLSPRLADQPVSARTGLFRGAIALAVNGVPIFNALNNRGDDAFLFGELDDFGGHAGRADDYHYHTAPLFLSATVGSTRPIAVALDGFALYGAVEPDGSAMLPLDDYNGHRDTASGYHYHGTKTYPYINGGMKGVVRVSDQVEPQPSVTPVRPAGTPLSGAVITRNVATGASNWTLEYQIAGRTSRVDYRIEGTRVTFVFTDPTGASRTEVYNR